MKTNEELKGTTTATCGAEENVYWLPIDKLKDYKAFPKFLAEKLECLGDGIEHIVTRG